MNTRIGWIGLWAGMLSTPVFAQADSLVSPVDTVVYVDTTSEQPAPARAEHFFQGNVGVEGIYFYASPYLPDQRAYQMSGLGTFTYHFWNARKNLKLVVQPYIRFTLNDRSRSHADLRDAYLMFLHKKWDVSLGYQTITMGYAQGFSLMNVLNQTDELETPWSPVSLGQPMANIGFVSGTFSLRAYVMPFFREKQYPDAESRLYIFPLPIDYALTKKEERPVNWAVRSTKTFFNDKLETDAVFYSGLAPAPYIGIAPGFRSLTLDYRAMQYLGVGLQYVLKGLQLRTELARRWDATGQYYGINGGLEYPFANVLGSGVEVTLSAEYMYDSWRDKNHFPFAKMLLFSGRVDMGDIQSTTFQVKLLSMLTESNQRIFANIEGSRRFFGSWEGKVSWIAYAGRTIPQTDVLTVMQHMNNVTLTVKKYF